MFNLTKRLLADTGIKLMRLGGIQAFPLQRDESALVLSPDGKVIIAFPALISMSGDGLATSVLAIATKHLLGDPSGETNLVDAIDQSTRGTPLEAAGQLFLDAFTPAPVLLADASPLPGAGA